MGGVSEERIQSELATLLRARVTGSLRPEPGWGLTHSGSGAETLAAVVAALHPTLYQQDPLEALRAVLERAIARVGGEQLEINGGSVPYSAALRLLSSLEPIDQPDSGKRYDAVIQEIKKLCSVQHWSRTASNGLTAALRSRLATSLFDLYEQSQRPQTHGSQTSLVPRPDLRRQISEWRSSTHNVLSLWGESGNGQECLGSGTC